MQPTCLMGCVWASLGLATYRSYGVCGASQFGAVCWQPRQPTCLMGCVGASLGLYVGNQQVLWGALEPVCGCMLATYRSYRCLEASFGAGRQPTGLMGCVGASLGLYVGNLHVLWGVLEPVCGCMLATYRSYGVCLSQFGAGNLQVLLGVWSQFAAVCWQPGQPTCLLGCVGASLGLYAGNLQVLWSVFEPVWGCMLATCRSYGVCWSQFGAGNLKVLWGVWSQFGAVCWQMLAT